MRTDLSNRAATLVALGLLLASTCHAQDERSVTIEFLTPPETVVAWKRDKCEEIDIPDTGLRAFRRFDGQVVALASHYETRTLVGPNISSLRKNGCGVALKSKKSADPSSYDDQTWLAATWTDDGKRVTAIGHNEYHGEMHAGMCAGKTPRECRYGALTLFVSQDGGEHFGRAALRPIAAVPEKQKYEQGRDTGFFQPSNIFQYEDMKYVFVRTSGGGGQKPAACLMRAKDPAEPGSWEIYDGSGFRRSLFDPYKDDSAKAPICAQVSTLNGMVWSVLRHRQRGVYIAMLTVIDPATKKLTLATALSRNLLDWSKPRYVEGIDIQRTEVCDGNPVYIYPSLVDPDSPSRNFDTTDDEAVLFLTAISRQNCKMTMNRDLVSRRVRFVFAQ